ncbi:MAG: hypothetical protein QOI66_2163 [Myxococcales bacterium]|jgi:hypothetical protein|nr:hypothetical protein [Myxococcales bacterium]
MNRDRLVRDWSCGTVLIALCAVASCADPSGGEGLNRPDASTTDDRPAGGDSQGGGSPAPFIQVRADLADGTTNVGQGPFKVSYYGVGRMIDAPTLGQLSARLALRIWPEGAVISTAVTIAPVSPSNNNDPRTTAVVEIAPGSALEDRWYSLEFGPAEQDVSASQSFDGGVPGVRLRPGSHPAVRLINFCQADVPGSKFIVAFSEPVTAASPTEMFTVIQNGAPLTCRFDALEPQELHEFCSTLVPGPLTVTLGADKVQGAGGASLATVSWSIDTSTLPVVESGCVGYRVGL